MRNEADEIIPTRASLLHRLKDLGDQASWQQFSDIYRPLIYNIARQAGLNDAEAQDVAQETMAAVAAHIPGFTYDPAKGTFKAWLLNMTRWRIINQMRQRAKRGAVEAEPLMEADTGTVAQRIDPASNILDALWEAEWQHTLLSTAVATIKRRVEPQNYQLFDFYVNKEWPAAKVAATFNVSVDQVYLAKHRVTEMLKAEVTRLDHEGA